MNFFVWYLCILFVINVVDTFALITQISPISLRPLKLLKRDEFRLNDINKNRNDEDISSSSTSSSSSSSVMTRTDTLDIHVDKSSVVDNKKFGTKWANDRGMEPGYGGIWPGY